MRAYIVQLPPRRVHNWASKMHTSIGRHVLLELESEDGVSGFGEAPALASWGGPHGMYYGETPETVVHIARDYLLPALAGKDVRQIADCHRLMDRVVKGHPYAKAAVDLAILDLVGRSANLPVYALLGGKLRDSLPLCHSLGIMEDEQAEAEAVQAVAEGARTIKLKTGLDPERDVSLVTRLRRRLGDDVALRVDANEGYRDVDTAIDVTRRMQAFGILFHEQPVAGVERLGDVQRRVDVPVMADESAWSARDIPHLRAAGITLISLYYSKPGGLWRAHEVGVLLAAMDMRCDIGGSIEMGVGVAANLHLGVSVEALAVPSVCPIPNVDGYRNGQVFANYYLDDVLAEPLRYEDGELYVPDGPGLGVVVDRKKLLRYAVEQVEAVLE